MGQVGMGETGAQLGCVFFMEGGREGGMEGVRIVDYPIERWVNLYRCGRVIL